MTRAKIFIAALAFALAIPSVASAHCGQAAAGSKQGSFIVTCENGVKVYRHQAMSGIPKGISPERAQLKAEALRAKTARAQIAANARAQAADARLRERELAIKEARVRAKSRTTRRRTYLTGRGVGYRSGGFARPVRVRGGHRTKR